MDYWWWLQIGADVILLAAVGALLWRTQRMEVNRRRQEPMELEAFIVEAGNLSQEFDRLLAEKRELVRTTLNTLDERLAELKELSERLSPRPVPPPAAQPAAASVSSVPSGKTVAASRITPSPNLRPNFGPAMDAGFSESEPEAALPLPDPPRSAPGKDSGGVTATLSNRKKTKSAVSSMPPWNEAASGMQNFRNTVHDLSAQGKSAQEIAQATGRPRGEVELVLGLLK